MKERPILFSAPMVRALLAGTKSQTRRIVKPQPERNAKGTLMWGTGRRTGMQSFGVDGLDVPPGVFARCPYGQPGDQLWVRETWRIGSWDDGCGFWIDYRDGPRKERLECPDVDLAYRLIEQTGEDLRKCNIQPTNGTMYEWTPGQSPLRWRPSIHMPRWASRITLEITSVRAERLQDISETDAMAEGIVRQPDGGYGLADTTHYHFTDPRECFWSLWEAINGEGSVAANPWVWVVEFKRLP